MSHTQGTDEDLWTDELRACPTGAAQVDLSAITEHAVRHARRRLRASRGAAALAGLAAVAGVCVVATRPGPGPEAALVPAAALAPPDPAQSASYWHVRLVEQAAGQVPTAKDTLVARTPDLVGAGTAISVPTYRDSIFAGGSSTAAALPGLSWADMWQLPQTATGLVDYFDAHETDARLHDDATVYRWAAHLLTEPAPQAVHLAAVDVLRDHSGAPQTTASDARGRHSLVFTLVTPPGQQLQKAYVDPVTGLLNEMDYTATSTTSGAPPQQWVYEVLETTDTATAVTPGSTTG